MTKQSKDGGVRAGGSQTICQPGVLPCNNDGQLVSGSRLRDWLPGPMRALGHPAVQPLHGAMQLKAGKRKDEALREAMLAVKKTKPQPYYWAAFQVIGETSQLPNRK